ncbi:tetratricopeptide repeat protein [Sphingopyxis fribergensis]
MSAPATAEPLLRMAFALPLLLWAGEALAQRGGEKVLGDASVAGTIDCPTVTIHFTGPIRYSGASPTDQGTEVRLRVDMVSPSGAPDRDFLPVPDGGLLVRSIAYEPDAVGGPVLAIHFRTLTRFEVSLGHDSQSLVLSLRNIARHGGCPVEQPADSAVAPLETDELRRLQGVAEEAVANGQYEAASDALDRILGQRDTAFAPRALELSGMIHERRDERGPARLRYEEYLRRFSGSPGADRVRQRLAALGEGDGGGQSPVADGQRWRTTFSGGLSQFYSRDTSRNVFVDARRPDPVEEVDRRVNIDQLLTAIDINMAATDGETRINVRAAGSYTLDWRPVTLVGSSRSSGDDTQRISALYFDAQHYRLGLSARIGRQSLFGSGVFGRFDGIRAGWAVDPSWTLHAQAGRPVFSTRTDRIVHDRGFYGFTLGYAPRDQPLELQAYWFDQRSGGLVDRQAVGVEARYTTPGIALWGLADFDVGFGTLGHAFLNATVPLSEGGSLGVQFDQQYYPSLSLANAAIGQPVHRLVELKQLFSRATLEQLARDRSARTRSMSVVYTQPVTPQWQANLDLVVSRTEGLPASGGVDAIAGSGTEYYLGAQMTGNGIVENGDTLIFGVRHARTARFRILSFDSAARFPFGIISVEPRFRFARRTDRFGPGYQNAYRPSLRITGAASPTVALDAEVGFTFLDQRWSDAAFVGKSDERATLINIGYRYSF